MVPKRIGTGMLLKSYRAVLPGWVSIVLGAASLFVFPLAAQHGPANTSAKTNGNAAAGKAIFDGKGECGNCHSIDDRGASLGPDLEQVGITRTTKSLRLALTDPDAEIFPEYYTVVVETKSGETIRGLTLNEDDLSIQIRDINGNPRSFLKDDLKSSRREQRSLMPSYASRLTAVEIEDVIAYLRTLRGSAPAKRMKRTRQPDNSFGDDIGFLNRLDRDADDRPDTLINSLDIPAGASVADIGSGTGYFTWRLAQKVGPKGKVFAVDVQQTMLDLTAATLKQRKLSNVQLVLGKETDPRLPPASLDLVLIANSYHEFSEPEAMMAAVNRSLKPNGRLVVIEYSDDADFGSIDNTEKMTIEQIRTEIEPQGFQLDQLLDFLPNQNGLIFTKRR
jgi:putative heme-binding domain-containing protein